MFLIKWMTLMCMHVCKCWNHCDTLGNIPAHYWKLERSNVLVMMFAFPLVPWPLLAWCFTISTRGLGWGTWKEMHRSLCFEVKMRMTRDLISTYFRQTFVSFEKSLQCSCLIASSPCRWSCASSTLCSCLRKARSSPVDMDREGDLAMEMNRLIWWELI